MPRHKKTAYRWLFAAALLLIVGCASTPPKQQSKFLFSLLPKDCRFYLCFPVQQNMTLAEEVISSAMPNFSAKNRQKLLQRLDTVYGGVSGKDFYAAATGSFPKAALGFVLKEKNGWQTIKSADIPATQKYYVQKSSSLELAFPSSSVAVAGKNVLPLLQSYEEYDPSLGTASAAADFFLQQEQNNPGGVCFYLKDAGTLLPSLEGNSFKLSFPFGDGYGYLIPEQVAAANATATNVAGTATAIAVPEESFAYQMEAFLNLTDSRALRPVIAALKIAARTLETPFEVEAYGKATIRIHGISVTPEMISALAGRIIGS